MDSSCCGLNVAVTLCADLAIYEKLSHISSVIICMKNGTSAHVFRRVVAAHFHLHQTLTRTTAYATRFFTRLLSTAQIHQVDDYCCMVMFSILLASMPAAATILLVQFIATG